jgi:hypothetical protein
MAELDFILGCELRRIHLLCGTSILSRPNIRQRLSIDRYYLHL